MNAEVEASIRENVPWSKLTEKVKQQLGHSPKEYDKWVVTFSVKNQVRYKGNLVRHVRKDEKKYYTDLISYSRQSLMLFPYHLSDVVVKGLVLTPFHYYVDMLESLIAQEKSYDSLPNFTAADCLRLLGIGRNQYIDLMNQSRSSRKFGFFRKSSRELLPTQPVDSMNILPWWTIQVGYVTEDDMKSVDKAEHALIDQLIDNGSCPAGHIDYSVVLELFKKGLIYFDVPIEENDYVIVPPLEGFVMNRVLGDYFETLLYKIFVSIDENTTVAELAAVLEVNPNMVRDAVSLYCRLGFAKKKNAEMDSNDLHPSWYEHLQSIAAPVTVSRTRHLSLSSDEDDSLIKELNRELEATDTDVTTDDFIKPSREEVDTHSAADSSTSPHSWVKKIAFVFDSTLTAYLMMGNLSPGLKNHAVTMFEVGKLCDESLDSLVTELEKVSNVEGEGEAARYFSHAITLRDTVIFLRQNEKFKGDDDDKCLGLDLIRCESLQSLDQSTACRLLSKNYALLVSMAPLASEIRPVAGCNFPPHLGPAIPEVSSVWFKLFTYHVTGSGPPSLLLPKGSRLHRLPRVFEHCSRLLVTSWGHEPSEIPTSGALAMILDALQHSAILVQALCSQEESETKTKSIPFPILYDQDPDTQDFKSVLQNLGSCVDLKNACGFVTLLDFSLPTNCNSIDTPSNGKIQAEHADLLAEELDRLEVETSQSIKKKTSKDLALDLRSEMRQVEKKRPNWILLDLSFGIPLFDSELNKGVCERITSNDLWKKDSLDRLTRSSQNLCEKLMEFVAKYQDLPVINNTVVTSHSGKASSNASYLAYPTHTLFFNGTAIEQWR